MSEVRSRGTWIAAIALACVPTVIGAGQSSPPPATTPAKSPQVIKSRVELITSDVIVHDARGRFVHDLKKDDFEVREDGIRQQVVTLTVSRGGRIFNFAPAARPRQEGVVLPPAYPVSGAPGRIFLLFIDDLHLDFVNTGRIRDLLKRIATDLIHDGDMFGIVSTGPSSIAVSLTYDRKRLDEAIRKIAGSGLKPREILAAPHGQQGSAEVRHRAHVAFSTAREMVEKLAQVRDRRKAVIFVSNGYDLDAFRQTRENEKKERAESSSSSERGNTFAFADVAGELADVTRAANRANASIYAFDPRGLVAGSPIDEKVDMADWNAYVRTAQDTLRVLAEQTGGFALVNRNDFDRAIKQLDAETSDYYVLGYYSNNTDSSKRNRALQVTVRRSGLTVKHRSSAGS
jgi:VWFA-related protein